MTTIGAHQENKNIPHSGPAGTTVHEVHHRVCAARLRRCPPGRTHPAHHGRRRPPVSHYRAAGHSVVLVGSPNTLPEKVSQRGPVMWTVLAITTAVALIYVGAVRVLEPGINDRVVLLGVFLIGISGAVVMNAITVESTNRPTGNGA